MPTLAQTLQTTTPVSTLRRKVRRLGLETIEEFKNLAVRRGCHHYTNPLDEPIPEISREQLSDAELTILLLCGENPYDPNAIRCAAQLARSARISASRLAQLAIREKCERVLAYIAHAGLEHDTEGKTFWGQILKTLHYSRKRPEPHLPHWTRFVSMPGYQRNGMKRPMWLQPGGNE